MKKAIADMWVKALRSGEYKQTMYTLREGNKFCCLGVLCNLHAQTHPEFAAKQEDFSEYGGMEDVPPEIVLNWAGLKSDVGSYSPNELPLAHMNDNGDSFFEIADTIEKNWRNL